LTDHTTAWKLANFVLLAGGLGYLIYKKGGAYFRTRSEQIRQGIAEAARFKGQAEARSAQVEQRLAGLSAEIENLRQIARQESLAEGERVRLETERALGKIQAQAEQEIVSAVKAAHQELKAHSAELAVRLAEQAILRRITPEIEDRLVASTIGELERCQRH
jgi:F-type H+-transporting ATPase subunit b